MSDPDGRMVEEKKAELLREIRQALRRAEEDLESKKPDTDELLAQAEAKQDKLLDLLNNQMHQFETEKAGLNQKIQDLMKEAEENLRRRSEAEAKADRAGKENTSLERRIEELAAEKAESQKKAEALMAEKEAAEEKAAAAWEENAAMEKTLLGAVEDLEKKNVENANLLAELEKAIRIAEAAENDRKLVQGKLDKFQENWERMIAGQ